MKKLKILLLLLSLILLFGCSNEKKLCEHEFVNGECIICHEKCEHNFVDGICTICHVKQVDVCNHEFEKGKCLICGYECQHEFVDGECSICHVKLVDVCEHTFEDGVCSICGYECVHKYQNGRCTICGLKCRHEHNTDGICDTCGVNIQSFCRHKWENGVCTICSYHCPHPEIFHGYCLYCGINYQEICEHTFKDGVCTYCEYECPHEGVSCGHRCEVCRYIVQHNYWGGKCQVCGKEGYESRGVPSQLYNSCDLKGTVEMTVFNSWNYEKNYAYENTFFVYLPYGYDTNNRDYNVLYLLHGSGENAAYWLAQLGYKGGYTEDTLKVLDNLFFYGVVKDTIVVTPTQNLNGTNNFHLELVNNIMPLVETKYRTKAHLYGRAVSSIKSDEFISSRDYRAFAGLSQGAIIAWRVMAYCLPYFSYFGMYSGGGYAGMTDLKINLQKKDNPYTINYAYHSCGNEDSMYAKHLEDFKDALAHSNGKLVENENWYFLTKPGFGHRYASWIIDLYNSLGFAFFKTKKQ